MNLNFSNTDKILAAVDLDALQPRIDLSAVDFIDPFAVIYLGMFIRHHTSRGKALTVVGPKDQAKRYLGKLNFWRRFNFAPDVVAREEYVRRFVHETSFNDVFEIGPSTTIAEEVADHALGLLRRQASAVNRSAVAEAIAELVDNFAIHAEGEIASCVMQRFPVGRTVSFVIGDCGVGIRRTLAYNPRWAYLMDRPHGEAIVKAFDPLVSRRAEGGTGLTLVADTVEREHGRLMLASGDAWVRIEAGQRKMGSQAIDLPGVQVEISFPERT